MSRILDALVILCILAVNVFGKDDAKPESDDQLKTFRRLIPADVLRGKNTEPITLVSCVGLYTSPAYLKIDVKVATLMPCLWLYSLLYTSIN